VLSGPRVDRGEGSNTLGGKNSQKMEANVHTRFGEPGVHDDPRAGGASKPAAKTLLG
jgi:hypothetical protein